MSHPNELSEDYPMQGDTWKNAMGKDCLTVTLVTPTGFIHYIKGIHRGVFDKERVTLETFKQDLIRFGLGIPAYCTTRYIRTHGLT